MNCHELHALVTGAGEPYVIGFSTNPAVPYERCPTSSGETATFPVARDFPHGLMCPDCGRGINDGEPYSQQLTGMVDDLPTVRLCCVYCAHRETA